MCGILFSTEPIEEEKFKKALRFLDRRGPDAVGYFAHKNFQLGVTRLKIQDLSDDANMPFFSADGRYCTIFNGEVYNHKELAKKYAIDTITTSDTEVLLKLYILRGEKMLEELNGMFAFVIYDRLTETYFIARDRLGVKPLYSYKDKIFCSEIRPLLELTGDTEFDAFSIRQYLKLRGCFNGRTVYKNIRLFPAGSFSLNGMNKIWWKLEQKYEHPPSDDELYYLLSTSLIYRLIGDVPVGLYLSGGLDSSSLASMLTKIYTWSVSGGSHGWLYEKIHRTVGDESKYAYRVASMFGHRHRHIKVEQRSFDYFADGLIDSHRIPIPVPNEILLTAMSLEASRYNTVILSGEGSDELFHGYRLLAEQPELTVETVSKKYIVGQHDDPEVVEDAIAPYRGYGKNGISALFQLGHLQELLLKLDRATMYYSIEGRVPFCDYRLVERLFGVDPEWKTANGVIKAPLKRLFSYLPKEVLRRKKIGLPVALNRKKYKDTAGWLKYNVERLCGR